MTFKDKAKDFWHKLKIFTWFLFTEPWRQFKEILRLFLKVLESLNKTMTWAYIAIIALMVSLFLGNKYLATLLLGFFLFTVLLWEWQRGFFIHRYRQAVIEKMKKKSEDLKDEDYVGKDWTEKPEDINYDEKRGREKEPEGERK